MPRQSVRQQVLQGLDNAKANAQRARYYMLLGQLANNLLDDESDIDMSSPPSSSPSSPSSSGSDSSSSGDSDTILIADYFFEEFAGKIQALEDEVARARYLQSREPLPRAPQMQLLNLWAFSSPQRFQKKLRVTPGTFGGLVGFIEKHPIFSNRSNNPQLPPAFQLAIFLNCVGHYGNAATSEDIAEWAGVSVGTVYNCSKRIMIALMQLHDHAFHFDPNTDERDAQEKEKSKMWSQAKTCRGWRGGYLVANGSCFSLFQKPGMHGETFYDKKCNYSINAQVCFYFYFP